MTNILNADDQAYHYEFFSLGVTGERYDVVCVGDGQSDRGSLEDSRSGAVLSAPPLQGFEGRKVFRYSNATHPSTPVLIVTAYDKFLHDLRPSQPDGYTVRDSVRVEELQEKRAEVSGWRTGS